MTTLVLMLLCVNWTLWAGLSGIETALKEIAKNTRKDAP